MLDLAATLVGENIPWSELRMDGIYTDSPHVLLLQRSLVDVTLRPCAVPADHVGSSVTGGPEADCCDVRRLFGCESGVVMGGESLQCCIRRRRTGGHAVVPESRGTDVHCFDESERA